MTLYTFLKNHADIEELTVWDTDYDIEFYMYRDSVVTPRDDWDRCMQILAKKLIVKKENWSASGVVVNLTSMVKRHLSQLEDLFRFPYDADKADKVEYIVCNINFIVAGNVSEKWMKDFVRCFETVK